MKRQIETRSFIRMAPFIVGLTIASLFVACARKGDESVPVKLNAHQKAKNEAELIAAFPASNPTNVVNRAFAAEYLASGITRTKPAKPGDPTGVTVDIYLKDIGSDNHITVTANGLVSNEKVTTLTPSESTLRNFKVEARCMSVTCTKIAVQLTDTQVKPPIIDPSAASASKTTPAKPDADKPIERKMTIMFQLPALAKDATKPDFDADHMDPILRSGPSERGDGGAPISLAQFNSKKIAADSKNASIDRSKDGADIQTTPVDPNAPVPTTVTPPETAKAAPAPAADAPKPDAAAPAADAAKPAPADAAKPDAAPAKPTVPTVEPKAPQT